MDVNSRVLPTYFYYLAPPNLAVLKRKVLDERYVLLHGPRASGKSTTLLPLRAELTPFRSVV